MVKGVIFDLDGVIVTTDNCHYLAWKRMADEEGIYFDRAINEIQIQEDESKGIVTLGVDAGAQSRYGTFNIWEG